MIRNKLLCSAVLACLTPFAASAADGYLTPSKNGGSGHMPSGYSHLYFELSDSDWAGRLKLPQRPQQGDRVTLSSMAKSYAVLFSGNTVFSEQIHIPIDSLSNAEFRWSEKYARWDVIGGLSARVVYGQNRDTLRVPHSEHLLTQVGLYDTKRAASVDLPSWAPNGAVLVVANASSTDVDVRVQSGPASGNSNCEAGRNCAFVFGADGAWHVRLGNGRVQAATQLPTPEKRWSDVFLGNPADDVTLPLSMRLPSEAVCGDIYQFTNLADARFTQVLTDNTDLPGNFYPAKGTRYTFRFDGAQGRWIHQRVK